MQANYTNTSWQNFLDHPALKDVFIKLVCSSFYEKSEASHKFWIRSFADKATFKDLQKLATYIETTTGLLCDVEYAFTGSTISVYNHTDSRNPDFVKELFEARFIYSTFQRMSDENNFNIDHQSKTITLYKSNSTRISPVSHFDEGTALASLKRKGIEVTKADGNIAIKDNSNQAYLINSLGKCKLNQPLGSLLHRAA